MEIQIDLHTLKRAEERGTNEKEIKDAVETGFEISAKYGKRCVLCYRTGFNNNRNRLRILWQMGGLR